MTEADIRQRVLGAQTSVMYQHAPQTVAFAFFSIFFAWWLLRPVSGEARMDLWALAISGSYLARLALVWAYGRAPRPAEDADKWVWFLVPFAAVTGALWGLLGTVLFPEARSYYAIVAIGTIIGVAASSILLQAWVFRVSLVFVLPLLIPSAIQWLASGERQMFGLGLLLVLFVGVAIVSARRLEADTRRALRQRFEMEKLAAEEASARTAADTANAAKSMFLAAMSHEIRTPLNGVIATADLLRSTELDAEQAGYTQTLHASAESLLDVINRVLDFSKIEAGHMELEARDFDLLQHIAETVEILRPRAAAKDIALRSDMAANLPAWVTGDAGRLRQILLNLIGNAIRFTDAEGVELRAGVGSCPFQDRLQDAPSSDDATHLWFAVIDSGIGIKDEDRRRLFRPFAQADNTGPRRYGGTGLGLAICKHLVGMMGGEIGLNTSPGAGSTFWFTCHLPVAPALSASTPQAQQSNDRRPLHGRVLLVEDNAVNRLVALAMLEKLGLDAAVAENGREALERLTGDAFDAILMDCNMPEMDGFEATRRIRGDESQAVQPHRIPIIALTADAFEGDREHCLAAGMDDYVAKPFVLATLRAVLAKWLTANAMAAA